MILGNRKVHSSWRDLDLLQFDGGPVFPISMAQPTVHYLPRLRYIALKFCPMLDVHLLQYCKVICILLGCLEEIAFEALFQLDLNGKNFEKSQTFINGLDSFKAQVKQHISAAESSVRL